MYLYIGGLTPNGPTLHGSTLKVLGDTSMFVDLYIYIDIDIDRYRYIDR